MTLSLAAACLWAIIANVLAVLPSADNHWRRAWGLIVVGIPLLGWVTYQNGPVIGFVVMAAGASVLRWPLLFALRRLGNLRRGRT
jgi:hypothetical protein